MSTIARISVSVATNGGAKMIVSLVTRATKPALKSSLRTVKPRRPGAPSVSRSIPARSPNPLMSDIGPAPLRPSTTCWKVGANLAARSKRPSSR